MMRETDGTITSDMDDAIRFELVLGTRGRSAEQFDIWQAVYSPVGEDGYPEPIIDPRTGAIDHKVADYWKEHYDLDYIMQRDWKTLGPKLVGKLHFAVGERQLLSGTRRPADAAVSRFHRSPARAPTLAATSNTVPARDMATRGGLPGPESSGTIHQRLMPAMLEQMLKAAPSGADVKSWLY